MGGTAASDVRIVVNPRSALVARRARAVKREKIIVLFLLLFLSFADSLQL